MNNNPRHVSTAAKNGVDCRLFSIAFATSLAFGEDPSNSTYDSAALRAHLIKCLTSERITPFTKIGGKQVVRCPKKFQL